MLPPWYDTSRFRGKILGSELFGAVVKATERGHSVMYLIALSMAKLLSALRMVGCTDESEGGCF